MSCDSKMFVGFPNKETLKTVRNEEVYKSHFFGGLVSTNVPNSTKSEWDGSKADYAVGDWVKIGALKNDYLCGEGGNRKYPPSSSMWHERTSNERRMVDSFASTKTVHTGDIVNIYSVKDMNYVIGHFIEDADRVIVETLESDMATVKETIYDESMRKVMAWDCFSCCNPPFKKKKSFSVSVNGCKDMFVRVTIKKTASADTVEVGTLTVVSAVSGGKPERDTKIKFDDGIEYTRTKMGGAKDLRVYNQGATITATGGVWIDAEEKKTLFDRMVELQFLVFVIYDFPQVKALEGVILGKFETGDLNIWNNDKTKYNFKLKGVIA